MTNENNSLKKWLDKLQEESWNLELIISGFSIFGLFKAKAFLEAQSLLFEANDYLPDSLMAWAHILFFIVYISVFISIIFLLIHVFLRGLWIGAIGFRYVSGEIDYNKLHYDTSITNYLKKKLGNFDNYILKLEKLSSLIFGYTFLLILVLFSVFLYVLFIWVINNPFSRLIGNTVFWWIPGVVFPVFAILLGIFIAIDFFTGGALKKIKNKWFIKIYIFFNKVVSLITLSFLWKPLYFNLVDKKKTKWLIYLVIPIFGILYAGTQIKYSPYSIFPENFKSDRNRTITSIAFKERARVSFQTMFYDNLRKQNEVVQIISLPNHKIKTKSIELFVKLYSNDEKSITQTDSTIKHIAIKGFNSYRLKKSPYEDELLSRRKAVSSKNNAYYLTEQQLYRKNLQKILSAAKKLYTVKINGELINNDSIDILFHQHNNQQEEGFLLLFQAENIEKGMNLLTLEKLTYNEDRKEYDTLDFTIPLNYVGQ